MLDSSIQFISFNVALRLCSGTTDEICGLVEEGERDENETRAARKGATSDAREAAEAGTHVPRLEQGQATARTTGAQGILGLFFVMHSWHEWILMSRILSMLGH